jgi:hypothetical protein
VELVMAGHFYHPEIYDVQGNKFITVGTMRDARESHTATLLKNGNVLIVAGTETEEKM